MNVAPAAVEAALRPTPSPTPSSSAGPTTSGAHGSSPRSSPPGARPPWPTLRPWVAERLALRRPARAALIEPRPRCTPASPTAARGRRATAVLAARCRPDGHPRPVGRRRPPADPARRPRPGAGRHRRRRRADGFRPVPRCSPWWSRSPCRSRSTTPTTTPTAPAAPTPTGWARCGWSVPARPRPAGAVAAVLAFAVAGVAGLAWPRCRAGGWSRWARLHGRGLDLHRRPAPLRLPGPRRGLRLRVLRPGRGRRDDVRADRRASWPSCGPRCRSAC